MNTVNIVVGIGCFVCAVFAESKPYKAVCIVLGCANILAGIM